MTAASNNNENKENNKNYSNTMPNKKVSVSKRQKLKMKPLAFKIGSHRSVSMDAAQSLFQLAVRGKQFKQEKRQQQRSVGKKQVRFAPMATVVTVSKLSKEESEQSWYESKEYRAFDQERRRTIAAVQWARGDLGRLDPEHYTMRGLEKHLSRRQVQARKFKTMQRTYYVLKQQHFQRCRGVSDPESLQAVSEMFSDPSTGVSELLHSYQHQKQYLNDPQSRRAYLSKTFDQVLML
jgi:hypothetical protein